MSQKLIASNALFTSGMRIGFRFLLLVGGGMVLTGCAAGLVGLEIGSAEAVVMESVIARAGLAGIRRGAIADVSVSAALRRESAAALSVLGTRGSVSSLGDAALLRAASVGYTKPFQATGLTRLPVTLRKGESIGTLEFSGENAAYRNQQGQILSQSRHLGNRTSVFNRATEPLGYSEHSVDGRIVRYYEYRRAGSDPIYRGLDVVLPDRILHLNDNFKVIAQTVVNQPLRGDTGLIFILGVAKDDEEARDWEERLQKEQEAAAKAERTARLSGLFRPGAVLVGTQKQGGNTWTFKIIIHSYSSRTGDFEGRIEYTNLGSIHSIEGQVVDDVFGFVETAVIKRGRSVPGDSHSYQMMPDGTLRGKWTSKETLSANWGAGKVRKLGAITQTGTESISVR